MRYFSLDAKCHSEAQANSSAVMLKCSDKACQCHQQNQPQLNMNNPCSPTICNFYNKHLDDSHLSAQSLSFILPRYSFTHHQFGWSTNDMYHRIRFKHQLWECFHHLPINKSYFLFQLQDLGFKDMGKCWESATNIYIYIQLCIPTRKGYYMGRGRPNGMESIGNNCQDHLPRVHQGCLLYCFRIVLGPWLLVRTCWWLWHTQKVLRCGQCHDDHIGPYQPTLRSHGLQDFLLKLKLRAPHKKPEAALQLAVSLPYNALVGNMGVLWSLGIRVAKGT